MEDAQMSQQERKKAQNRIAQRKRLKNRVEELEMLKSQLAAGAVPQLPGTTRVSHTTAGSLAEVPAQTVGVSSNAMVDVGIDPLLQSQPQTIPNMFFPNVAPHPVDLQQMPLPQGSGNGDFEDNQWWLSSSLLDSLPANSNNMSTDSSSITHPTTRSQNSDSPKRTSRSSPSHTSNGRGSISASTLGTPSTSSTFSKVQIPRCPGRKMMPILLSIQAAGYDSVDSNDSVPHWAQKSSRAHRLKNLLTELYEQSAVWQDNERKGLLDAAVDIAESLCQQQLIDLSNINEMDEASA
ncbi:hypothetical protein FH972_024724 [Carpinus fangiana]|uniref:BZIP domain-containing protein n=1 Tax=Carpinus fangiana TaxID=176857 RepID=A0A5N6KYU3_9ROSI|nr:hypothetical protein FH972_024724 [Carpinus fangiana]